MASNRHLGRIVALQSIYEYEVRTTAGDEVEASELVKRNLERYESEIEDKEFVNNLVDGVLTHLQELDEKLQPLAPEWPLEQISRVDHSILRLSLYELLYSGDIVPPKVAINEAVELAKTFGSDNSSKFVNGVLGTAFRTLVEGGSADGSTTSQAG
jgi:N utilization substance protein B